MNVKEFAEKLDMQVFTGDCGMDREISGAYICDLLSWVMSHADRGNIWITVHTHLNIVAVALLTEVACIVIPEGIGVEQATIEKAGQEGIAVLGTRLSGYEVCCRAYELFKGGL